MAIGDPSGAMIGHGSRVQIGSTLGGSPEGNPFAELEEITNITAPSSTIDMVDVSTMQSVNAIREFVPGLTDPGEMSFEMNFVPNSNSDNILQALRNEPPATRKRQLRIIFPNSIMWQFEGLLMTYEPTAPTDDKMTASVSFKVTGLVTRTVFTG